MQRYLSFNTSHVTLYHLCLRTAMVIITFQYISCYSLSWSVRRRQYHLCPFQYISCYSLSYHKRIGRYVVTGFQYISCYSLSNLLIMKRYCKNMFQYISCYSLSKISRPWSAVQIPFQYISCYSLSNYDKLSDAWDYCFNTSHVTLYLFVWCTAPYFLTVSIHLMLLFIRLVITFFFEMVCFNTSHVTLYQAAPMVKVIDCKFQYISCYSLSVCRIKNL